jgi:hypothetical protein
VARRCRRGSDCQGPCGCGGGAAENRLNWTPTTLVAGTSWRTLTVLPET